MEHFNYSKVYTLLQKEIQKGYIIHGTNSDFSTFNASKIQGGFRAKEGYGFYFTDTAYKAMEYGQIYKKVKKDKFNFLNGKDPIHLEMFDNPFLDEYYRVQALMDNSTSSREYYYYDNELNHIKSKMERFGNIFDIVLKTIKQYNLKTIGSIEYNIEYPKENIPKLIEIYKYYGFDGYHCDNVYTIFNFDKLNDLVEDVELTETMTEGKKKVRQGTIPYESDKFEIGFEGNQANGYAHVLSESEEFENMLTPFLKSIAEFMQGEGLNVSPFPKVELKWEEQEDTPVLSKTAYYAPQEMKVVLFCKDRHPKDVLRSYAHELIHHMQNLNGAEMGFTAEDNVKDNDRLEKLESEAYLKGNIYFRKWTECLRQGNNILNESVSLEDLDLTSFEVQDELNPDFWKNKRLDSRVRLKLLDIADDFTDFLNVDWVQPEDITMTGSLANYNWSDYSDIDLHIIIDFKKVDSRTKFVAEYFKSKKELWNNEHQNLTIFGFPVEVYVQDKNESHASSGVYSLERDKWIEEPEKLKNPKKKVLNQAGRKASKWMNKIDKLMSRYYPNETESEKEKILNDLDDIFDEIKDSRKGAFERGEDEMNPDNLTFKVLRRNGYLNKIWNKKTEIYDELNSINESKGNEPKLYHQTSSDFNVIKSIIENGLIPQDKNGEGKGIWFQAGAPFYNARTTMFSIPDTVENAKKYNFNPLFDGDIRIARTTIPFDELTVESIPFAVVNDNTILYSSTFTSPDSLGYKFSKRCGSVAKYIAENKNFKNVLIYTDLFEMFVEPKTSHYFQQFPHIKTDKLLK